jgi:hypothetical protein
MAEAGYADGFEVTMHYADLTWAGVSLSTNAQKIQADLAEIGITVRLLPGEVQVALEGYRNGTQGFGYWFWGPDKLDPVDFLEFLPGGKVAGERARWTPDMIDEATRALIARPAWRPTPTSAGDLRPAAGVRPGGQRLRALQRPGRADGVPRRHRGLRLAPAVGPRRRPPEPPK